VLSRSVVGRVCVLPVRTVDAVGSRLICARCTIAGSPLARLRGLMWKPELAADAGLLCRPSNAIHTFFMRFRIDVVFIDAGGSVVKIVERMPPRRIAWARGARAVLKLPAGQVNETQLRVGDQLRIYAQGAKTAS
jgi:uncharacterized membrane protein (UPF0127 family)